MAETKSSGILYLIPTVLAENTQHHVLPPQVIEVIQKTTVFLVENVRTIRRFISSLQLGINIDKLQFFEINQTTTSQDLIPVFEQLKKGNDVGILSEAGCPGIADPGSLAVAMAHKQHIAVMPLVGPSSILLTLMASGFNGQSFIFHGYLPIEKNERNQAIKNLEQKAIKQQQSQIFIETPYRNMQLLEAILQQCQPTTLLCLGVNVTATDGFVQTKTIQNWKKQMPDLHKKPTCFVIYGQ
jgi:16S rRNA (cytidine1402-2'-O)-methyltransferase